MSNPISYEIEWLIRNAAFHRELLKEASRRCLRNSKLSFAGLGCGLLGLALSLLSYSQRSASIRASEFAGLCVVFLALIMSYLVCLFAENARLLEGIQMYMKLRDELYRQANEEWRGEEVVCGDVSVLEQTFQALSEKYSRYLEALVKSTPHSPESSTSNVEPSFTSSDLSRAANLPWDRMWRSSVQDVDTLIRLLHPNASPTAEAPGAMGHGGCGQGL